MKKLKKFDILELYRAKNTVLTTKEIAILWGEKHLSTLKARIHYYVKQGKLHQLRRGIYVKDQDNYDVLELGSKIYTPSYMSFETVLREAGIIFQYYQAIFFASRFSRKVICDHSRFVFRKLKDEILYNPNGIVHRGAYSIASPERAFLDMIYLFPEYYFDNLKSLQWEKCFQLVTLYQSKQLINRLNSYHKLYA
ncbi:type IV toxin-antitoxin system AbiEi family antitoxin domain-containing protein [Candidatus Uhrbacteria bacterium]|nr:type IV toxin-antitoxin system AbiEi family antitoxin domain-containing protein [Candidatus Uhrbacteria bacterium]